MHASEYRCVFLVAGMLLAVTLSSHAAITVDSTAEIFHGTIAVQDTRAFTVAAGTDRKLVVCVSWENGDTSIAADWSGPTWDNEPFTVAVNSAGGRNSAILYLDNPTPGSGTITITFGVGTEARWGVMSLTGAADGVNVTSTATSTNGTLTTTVADTLVVGVYTSNNNPTITDPFTTGLYNGDSGSSEGDAGYQFEAAPGVKNYLWENTAPLADNHALAGFVPVNESPSPLLGNIAVIRSDAMVDATQVSDRTEVLSFDAGDGADKLIVAVSGEGGSVASLTYNGAAMTPAIVGGGRAKAIYYLDNPYTGGSADISLTLSGGLNNGIRMGAVSVAGTAVGADVTTSAAATNISITATTPNSFVFSVYGGNDDGVASAESPLTAIYGGTTGNAKGAAGYENAVGVGANSYTFTDDRVPPLDPASLAAAFKPRTPGGTIFRFR